MQTTHVERRMAQWKMMRVKRKERQHVYRHRRKTVNGETDDSLSLARKHARPLAEAHARIIHCNQVYTLVTQQAYMYTVHCIYWLDT